MVPSVYTALKFSSNSGKTGPEHHHLPPTPTKNVFATRSLTFFIYYFHFPQLRRASLRIPHHGQFHLLLPPHDSRLGPHRRPRPPHRHALRLRHTHDLFPAPGRFWRSLPLSRRPPDPHSRCRCPWDCGAVCGDGGVWDWMVDACLVDSYGNLPYGGKGAWNGGFGGGLGKFSFSLTLPRVGMMRKQNIKIILII